MDGTDKYVFDFGQWRLVPDELLLLKDGQPVPLAPKAFAILTILLERAGELVDKNELLESVWKDSFVEEANIQVHVSAIRKALKDSDGETFIETIPKRGYRFRGTVTRRRVDDGDAEVKESSPGEGHDPSARPNTTAIRTFANVRGGTAIAASAMLIVMFVGLAYSLLDERSMLREFIRPARKFSFSAIKIEKLTDSGGAFNADISTDGKYIAYETIIGDKYSVWLMEPGTASNVQVIAPSESRHGGITFSRNGEYLYFTVSDTRQNAVPTLYRVPKLGGPDQKLIEGVESPIGFSPDGNRLAFLRKAKDDGSVLLVSADLDGKDERTIAAGNAPTKFSLGKRPAWSPDGGTIACIGSVAGEAFLRVFTVNIADGKISPLTSEKWVALQDVVWMGDSENLLLTAQDDRNFGPLQMWTSSISSGGKAEKLTHEIKNYVGLSLSTIADSLVTTQSEAFNNIWLVPGLKTNDARQIVANKGGGRVDMSWTADGRIVYTSNATGHPNIFIMNANGSEARQLTSDTFVKRSPIVSRDDRYIVFVSSQLGPDQIWRMDLNGENQIRLTTEHTYRYPIISADGKWVVYTLWNDKSAHIWKVPITGGEPSLVKGNLPYTPNVSPDVGSVAYFEKDEAAGTAKLQIASLESGQVRHTIEIPAATQPDQIRWTSDGKAVMFAMPHNGTLNYWLQPADGSQAKPLTDFRQDIVRGCVFSNDNKDLACVRSSMVRDLVLFKGMFRGK